MATILKLTFANIKQKKFRSILIIVSIILSTGLIYSILSLSVSATKIFEQKVRKEVGNAELMILPKENSGEQYISDIDFSKIEGMAYHIPLISAYGYSGINDETVPIAFTGMSDQNYKSIYGLEFTSKTSESLADNNVYIGKDTAEAYHLKQNDQLKVTIAGAEYNFSITGIIEDQNNSLSYDIGGLKLMVSGNTLNTILKLDQQVNGYYVKSTSEYGKAALLEKLKKTYPDYQIKDVTDMSDIKQYITMIETSLLFMVLAVIMVSVFIIFSSFKIIAIERMPFMGTLRSIGATRKTTVKTLLLEAGFYGMIGGVLGDILGIFIISATVNMLLKSFHITIEDISYVNPGYLILALLIGLGLAVGSAIIPIIKMSRKSIRSIIFSEIQNEKHSSLYKTIIGFTLIISAFMIFHLAPLKLQLILDGVGIILVTIGGALIIPMVSVVLTKLLSLVLKPFYKDGFDIITANIKNDRTMMNNIMLLAMGLSIILMINNFSTAVSSTVTDVYATGKMDALASGEFDHQFIEKVKQVEGLEHVYTTKRINNISANNGEVTLQFIEGIDGQGYCQYAWDEFGRYLTEDIINKFTKERSIIVSKFTARKYNLAVGDVLNLDIKGKKINYEIAAIVPSIMNNGNMSFIYDKYLSEDAGIKNDQSIYVNIKDNADTKKVLQSIKELMPNKILPISTLKEMRDVNMKSNNMMFYIMKAISIIAMFIGVFGIFNNFTICFISRKKLYATMRSLGLSKAKTVQNMLSEAFCCGMLGTISGLILGTILLKAMCYLIEAMGVPADVIYYSGKDYLFVLISGIVISMISAVIPALSITRENIVRGLRYE